MLLFYDNEHAVNCVARVSLERFEESRAISVLLFR